MFQENLTGDDTVYTYFVYPVHILSLVPTAIDLNLTVRTGRLGAAERLTFCR